jgi:hypothetical protein
MSKELTYGSPAPTPSPRRYSRPLHPPLSHCHAIPRSPHLRSLKKNLRRNPKVLCGQSRGTASHSCPKAARRRSASLQEPRLHGHGRVGKPRSDANLERFWCRLRALAAPAFAPLCAIKIYGFPTDSKKLCRNLYRDVDEEVNPRRDETRAASLLILRTGPCSRSLRPVDTATDLGLSFPSNGYLCHPVPGTEGYFSLPLSILLYRGVVESIPPGLRRYPNRGK